VSTKTENFKKELKELLSKYDAHIVFDVGDGSDTHGIYDEQLTVEFNELLKGSRFKTVTESSILAYGWSVDKTDL